MNKHPMSIRMNYRAALIAALFTIAVSGARAEEGAHQNYLPKDTVTDDAGTSDGAPDQDPNEKPQAGHDGGHDVNGAAMPDMNRDTLDGGTATPPGTRDPYAYSDGYDFGPLPRMHMGDQHNFGLFLADRFEQVRTGGKNFTSYDVLAWYGRDFNRLWFKSEGELGSDRLQNARSELLWGHAVTPFWDAQLGARHDGGAGPERAWLALGFQGLAPYWFDVEATAYVGDAGRTALRVKAEYELLFTQKLILQPRVEAEAYGKDDAGSGAGAGLSGLTAGLRLRYEIRREFAPYVGLEWAGVYGGSADYARAAGRPVDEGRVVAGVRFWF